MFTSEPSLAQRIERMIDAVPIIDIYSRIDPRRPAAPDLATLMAEPPLRFALQGVGYLGDLTDPARPESERVADALPSLRLARNTIAAWCFYRILRDLYDFTDPELTVDNLPPLLERVARAAVDPAWPAFVLEKRARLTQLVTGLPASADAPDPASPLVESGLIAFRLDLAALDPGDADWETVRRAVFEQLDEQLEGPVRFASLVEPLDEAPHPVRDAILRWHGLHDMALQFTTAHPMLVDKVSRDHPTLRCCVLTNPAPAHRLEVLDRLVHRPNLALAPLLGADLHPSRLETWTLEAIERLSTSRMMGFASGMATAEWTYGAYVLARRATAAALSRAVAGGYFEEDEVPPLCRAIFHESPRRWLRLGE